MPPKSESDENLLSSSSSFRGNDDDTQVFEHNDQATFIICKSKKPYVNPTVAANTKPEDVMKTLNLDLGQKFVNAESKVLIWIIRFFSSICVEWWEFIFFWFWRSIPRTSMMGV